MGEKMSKFNILQFIFTLTNTKDKRHKSITIFGFKFKFKREIYQSKHWYNPFIKTCFNDNAKRDFLFGFIPLPKKEIYFNFPVDLVYLWVDGNDENWRQKKKNWEQQIKGIDFQANNTGRFVDNEELRYSLRSVEKFAPWINQIYIVTDEQIPKWLDLSNPKVKIIFHKDIIPKENLPLFNSEAIESYLGNIPGLSEHFLYGCDDYYFGKRVYKSFFYMPDGRPIIKLISQINPKHIETSMYARSVLKMQQIIKNIFNKYYPYAPHHNIDAYKKSDFNECIKFFDKDFSVTRSHKFRNEGDIQRVVISYYTLAKNQSVLKLNNKRTKKKKYDSVVFSMNNKKIYERFRKIRPFLFCTNDGEGITNLDRLRTKIFLEDTFPNKSSFELDETELGKLRNQS